MKNGCENIALEFCKVSIDMFDYFAVDYTRVVSGKVIKHVDAMFLYTLVEKLFLTWWIKLYCTIIIT